MNHKSIWEINTKSTLQKPFDSLTTDILIIGAGITGLTTAYFLEDSHKKITIIDKSGIGMGITAKTTAKITYLEQDIYTKLKKMHSEEISKKYYQSRKESINIITDIIKNNNISCDLQKVSSVVFTNDDTLRKRIDNEKELLLSWNENIKDYSSNNIKYGFIGNNNYVFNPLKYLNGLKNIIQNKVNIFEYTIAKSIKKYVNHYIVETNNGIINTNIIVLACHYPFFVFPYLFPLKTYIEREYVCAAKTDKTKNITAINIDKELYSIRYYKNYIIYGSNDHKLTSKIDYDKHYKKSREDFIKYFNKKPEYSWMNQDIISHDRLPIIGRIKDNLYISTAYNTWGMTNGTIGGKLISDLILKKENQYENIFNPRRINLPLIINSFIGIFHYLKVYIETIFHKNNPYYIKIKGITYGVYIDKNNVKHKIKLLCPHMKCGLIFNKGEKTWDCPCHGSRFDLDGNIINIPAVKKIS